MGVEQQQGSGKQMDLFDEALKASLRHGVSGKGGTGAGTNEERQSPTAWAEPLALTRMMMRSQAAGERVMVSVTAFLEGKLRLRVNQDKSAVAPVEERAFLGHRLGNTGSLGIAPKSLERMKDRLRQITRRNRGIALESMIAQVNAFTTGWVTYYRYAQAHERL